MRAVLLLLPCTYARPARARAHACSYDFPNTGGASVRDMASEIGDNVAGLLGMDRRADGVAGTADKVAGKIVDGANKAADTAKSALDSAKDTAKQG